MPVPVPLVLPVATHHPTWPPRRRSRCLTRLWHPPPSSASSKPPARAAGASGWSVTHILSPRDTEPPQPTPTKPIGTPPTTPTTTTTTREPSPCPEHPVGAAGPGGSRLPPAHGGEHEASGVSQSVCPVSSRPPPRPQLCAVLREGDAGFCRSGTGRERISPLRPGVHPTGDTLTPKSPRFHQHQSDRPVREREGRGGRTSCPSLASQGGEGC